MNLSVSRNSDDKSFIVKYDYNGCLPEDPNTIEVLFHLGNKKLKNEFRFDITGIKADIKITGFIDISLKQEKDGSFKYEVDLNLLAGSGSDFTIIDVSLELSELLKQFTVISNGDLISQGKKHYKFSGASLNSLTDKKGYLVKGNMKIQNNKTGEQDMVEFSRPYNLTVN